jgi:hypothetical protein
MTCYNLDRQQAHHAASIKSGDTMVVVVPLKEQPPKLPDSYEYKIKIFENNVIFESSTFGLWKTKLPYPIGARIGLRSKNKTIAWGTITSTRVDRVQNIRDETLL